MRQSENLLGNGFSPFFPSQFLVLSIVIFCVFMCNLIKKIKDFTLLLESVWRKNITRFIMAFAHLFFEISHKNKVFLYTKYYKLERKKGKGQDCFGSNRIPYLGDG